MIQLTRLNHHPLLINCDLIKLIENAPDTVLTLVTGEKIVVWNRARRWSRRSWSSAAASWPSCPSR
jgi:flagellar protein FlbD